MSEPKPLSKERREEIEALQRKCEGESDTLVEALIDAMQSEKYWHEAAKNSNSGYSQTL